MATADQIRQLYGRNHEREHIKDLLTADNVLRRGEVYDHGESWSTTKASDYQARTTERVSPQQAKQGTLKSNICFGSHTAEKVSVKKSDFKEKQFSKVTSFKPTNQINIIDLDPRYQTDKPSIASSHSIEFDRAALKAHQERNKVTIYGVGNPITNYLRATHFSLGSDPSVLETEAQAAFSESKQAGQSNSVAADRAREDKRTNNVFRNGDYNMTEQAEPASVFKMSYASSAAGVTSTQKGYDHVSHRVDAKLDDLKMDVARKLYNYLRQEFQNPRDPNTVNFRQAFALFDKKRTGFVSYESLSSVLRRVLGPSEQEVVGQLVSLFDTNKDGKIDYLEFERFLNQQFTEEQPAETSLHQDSYHPSLLEGAERVRKGEGVVDGTYQITTHFRLGEGNSEPSQSLYKSAYSGTAAASKPSLARPPPPSQMLPVEPDYMSTANSIQQVDYTSTNHNLAAIAAERARKINANKELHEGASFVIGSELDTDKEVRLQSLTASSYQPKEQKPQPRVKGYESRWNHLITEDALPGITAGVMKSEQRAAYGSNLTEALNEFSTNKNLRLDRVLDEKTSHLTFGNESSCNRRTEMTDQFKYPATMEEGRPAAGITGGPIATHEHLQHTEGKALTDPSVKSLQDAIKQTILEKCYNPRDPLNINLQKAFKEFDKNNTGKITVTGLREACKRLQLPVDDATLRRYFLELDKNGDGSIDYNEFADELGIHITNVNEKGMTTVMMSDYTPIVERKCGLNANIAKERIVTIQPSHYFHTSVDGGNTGLTTTQTDFNAPIDKFAAFQTANAIQ